jgi:hypothetical protein
MSGQRFEKKGKRGKIAGSERKDGRNDERERTYISPPRGSKRALRSSSVDL